MTSLRQSIYIVGVAHFTVRTNITDNYPFESPPALFLECPITRPPQHQTCVVPAQAWQVVDGLATDCTGILNVSQALACGGAIVAFAAAALIAGKDTKAKEGSVSPYSAYEPTLG